MESIGKIVLKVESVWSANVLWHTHGETEENYEEVRRACILVETRQATSGINTDLPDDFVRVTIQLIESGK
jgi:hypothetical protein